MTSPTSASFAFALVLVAACTPSRQATPAPATSQPVTQVAPAPSSPPAAPSSTSATAPAEPPKEPTPPPEEPRDKRAGTCTADGDCRAFSHYCDGCFCVPLAKNASDLKCKGAHTACFVDPCRAQRAACRKGACVLVGEAEK